MDRFAELQRTDRKQMNAYQQSCDECEGNDGWVIVILGHVGATN
jgi:hypothetical protein